MHDIGFTYKFFLKKKKKKKGFFTIYGRTLVNLLTGPAQGLGKLGLGLRPHHK